MSQVSQMYVSAVGRKDCNKKLSYLFIMIIYIFPIFSSLTGQLGHIQSIPKCVNFPH